MSKYPLSLRDSKTVSLFFKDILELHFPYKSKIMDPTCGERLLWADVDTDNYKVFYSDVKDFKYDDCRFKCTDYRKIDKRYYGFFDGIVFDPPYLFGLKSKTDKREDMYGGYEQSIHQLYEMLGEAPLYLINYLKIGGKLILKCSDQYYVKEHKFYDLSTKWLNSFTLKVCDEADYTYFEIIDKHIFKNHHISGTAWQVKNRESSIQNYTYYFVFRKVNICYGK